jgi:hypothetical protein
MQRHDRQCETLFGRGGEPRIPEGQTWLDLRLDMDKDVRLCNLAGARASTQTALSMHVDCEEPTQEAV